MKKLVIVALSAVLAVMAVEPAHAQDQKVLAIIDTAVDSKKIPAVIHEVCITLDSTCPNGKNFMEGTGAANPKTWPANLGASTYHGYNMTQAALAINPNLKVVFIRVSTFHGNGSMNGINISQASKWLSENASRFSIDAVSISAASIERVPLASCLTDTVMINSVASLNNQNVPTFIATGNDRSTTVVGFPACVNGVIGVGSLQSSQTSLVPSTNRGIGLDLVTRGDIPVTMYNGVVAPSVVSQTSGATVIAAAKYITLNQSKTFSDFLSSLPKVLGYAFIAR